MSTPTTGPALPAVGARFMLKGERGTVRYVGPVPPAKGDWLGVEWDNAARGKHDGTSADGTRYFTCRQPGAGSFLRPSPKAKLDLGSPFLAALRSRYALVPTFNAADTQQHAHHSRKNLAEIEIEVPNVDALFAKELVLGRLRTVGVGSRAEAVHGSVETEVEDGDAEKEVSCALDLEAGEQPGDIAKAIPNVKELDMSRSLLQDWDEVSKITKELPFLDTLLLHFNRFAPLQAAPPAESFARVRHLGLDGNLISWVEILVLSSSLPQLERLDMRRNKLRSFATASDSHKPLKEASDAQPLPRLKSLHLQENELHDWLDLVDALAQLPQLSQLVLSSNSFSSVPRPSEPDTRRFPALTDLAIDKNPLLEWTDVDALASWCCPPPSGGDPLASGRLVSLSVGGAEEASPPLAQGLDARDVRAIAVARIPTLQHVNGTLIRAAERRDAEIWYLGRVAEEALDDETRRHRHPRFDVLSQVHGFTKEDSAKRAHVEETETLRSRLIELRVIRARSTPPQLEDTDNEAKGSVKLLGTAPIRSSMTKIAKACGLKSREIKELWASLAPANDGADEADAASDLERRITVYLDNPSKELGWYGVQNGDYLLVVL
ncbi:hypothetical protein OC834_003165 [Tilletia horrida]|nr:hypothetical protein OC834_003165 [Tilletia horrida]